MAKYPEYKQFSLPDTDKEILALWEKEKTFQQSVEHREGAPSFTFYEGPPSANGMPGIHHVMARTVKDLFCRYKTLKGFQVKRKGGWDTHGLPIELQVEKTLGITKDDIGKTISIEEYNAACRKDVLKFKDVWDDITRQMGYWVDLDNPYITFENEYIESVWHLLKRLYDKDYLYKGFTIQPYSPMAGTGLSSHELNQPGCYRDVKDNTAVAAFKVMANDKSKFLFESENEDVRILAWTTTPWTLPSNTALAVGEKITYVKVKTFNPFSFQPQSVVLAKELVGRYFSAKATALALSDYKTGDKEIPYEIVAEMTGADLVGVGYEQLLPYVQPEKPAFKVIAGDFVSTTDGTGVVHIAPTFGSDDFRVAAQNNIPPMMIKDEDGNMMPLVDKRGRFVAEMGEFAHEYVKADYLTDAERQAEVQRLQNLSDGSELSNLVKNIVSRTNEYLSVDERIVLKLQLENKLFKKEKYEHSYPHCWRTDKPVLYYPLDSWFVRTTAAKDKLVELNNTINWKPASTGTGRFGNWLENLVDWNLSRSRYWGIPLPIWRTEDGKEELCIGSVAELSAEVEKAIAAGFMTSNPVGEANDLHRPYIDNVVLVSPKGEKMFREKDLIDVWFDSGAMPFAQWHYPFENTDIFKNNFPADFIAEGVDQTRGWFFTLHAIAVMLEESVAYKNVIANGLVLDDKGEKMSKRKGNIVDPFLAISTYGADAVRWYMISNSDPWENLKFSWRRKGTDEKREGKWKDLEQYSPAIEETTRIFFGTLYNTYNFFALYANVDSFSYGEQVAVAERSELDRWIISCLNSLVKKVDAELADYEPTRAVRLIEEFVTESLSNWYVRLSRRVFWKGELNQDKIAAYQTLYECLKTIAVLMAPFAPFYSEKIYRDLTGESVHLADFPAANEADINLELEEKMEGAQRICSLTHSIRKKVNIKVRQPLQKILIPVLDEHTKSLLDDVKDIILSEVNVKELAYLNDNDDASAILVKKAKPNFKVLGAKLGGLMKEVTQAVNNFGQQDIRSLEKNQSYPITLSNGTTYDLLLSEVDIISQDVEGWSVASDGKYTVALDVHIDDALRNEGVARELVNRIQNLRKTKGFDLTDRISIEIENKEVWNQAFSQFESYICAETLCQKLSFTDSLNGNADEIEVFDVIGKVQVEKL